MKRPSISDHGSSFELLDAEGDALVAFVDREDDCLDLVVLFENFGWVVDLACPGHVRDVDHTVDAFFELHEGAVGGKVADRAGDRRADRVAELDLVPWVAFELADAEGDFLLLDADAENDCGDFLIEFENIGRASDALDPGKLGNVDETFDAALDFDERAVWKELGDLTFDFLADRVLALDVFPRVVGHLLETERYTLFLAVHVEDHHVNRLADVKKLGRVVDAAPRHVGDVEESVHALEIDERTEVGDVLDRADDLVADLDGLEECLALLGALGFDDFAAGENDVLALVVDLDDFELVDVSDVFGEIFRWNDVHLRTGKEGFHADVDGETAFDDCFDFSANEAAVLVDFDDLVPVLFVGGFLLGENDHALIVFEALEEHFDFVADFDFLILEFVGWDGAFGLVADVHEDDLRADFEDGSLDDGSFTEIREFGVDQVAQLLVGGFCDGSTHMVWLVVWLVCLRFPSDNCPGKDASDGHRGSNRSSDKRKTEGEPNDPHSVCKTKDAR